MATTMHRRLFANLVVLASVGLACIPLGGTVLADTKESPKFYLVGVGPGDPDLMTLRAVKVIEEADRIFCPEYVRAKLASYLEKKDVLPASWRLFHYYGKDPSEFTGAKRRECEEIALERGRLIAQIHEAVEQGKTVAVLDNGDPLIYGPFDWCLEEFEDLNPVVVPGLSCFNAANAALRRGITSAEHTKSVILTGADWPGKTDTIDQLSVHRTTMVVFTMTAELRAFIQKLSVSYPRETPVALVKQAGYVRKEEVIQGTLGTILDQVSQDELPFEYLIYVGDFLTHRYKNGNNVPKRAASGKRVDRRAVPAANDGCLRWQ